MDAVVINNLRFTYPGSRAWALDIPHFRLAAGEHALITGKSGTGKSTLLHLIAGLVDPDHGEIRVAGTPISRLHGAKRDLFRGQHIGMIFQTFNLLDGFTALENVMAALMFSSVPRREHRARALRLLDRLGITDVRHMPERMSVGQQQRVAVARAVACGPNLVLADEPTASLDPENADAAVSLIREACAQTGAALLCTSHDPSMLARFERRHDVRDLAAATPPAADRGNAPCP